MLFLMFLLVFTKSTWSVQSVGSVLFYKRNPAECWTQDELAKLRARQIFENVAIPCRPPDQITAKYNRQVLRYFRNALRAVDIKNEPQNVGILKEALTDTIGAHLRSDFLPNSRFAYYAGYIPFSSTQRMHDFYDQLKKSYLNTQGLGWRVPDTIPLQSNLTVGKILIGPGKPFDPCEGLLIKRDGNNCIRIPLPKVEDSLMPKALALPFKSGGFVSLTSPDSENILLKYYTTAARCILRSSPSECRHTDFVNFNNELWHWMKKYVAAHLMDEQLYAAYGGVLRIAAAVQNYGKGLSRRLCDDEDLVKTDRKWGTIRSMMDKTLSFDADWTPPLALILVLGTALAICFLHIIYTYVLGRTGDCNCTRIEEMEPEHKASMHDKNKNASMQELNYTKVESSFPAVLPSHTAPLFNDEIKRGNRTLYRAECASASTQGRYENGDKSKIMSIKNIGKKISELNSSTDLTEEEAGGDPPATGTSHAAASMLRQKKPRSPPRIDASVVQLTIERRSRSSRVEAPSGNQKYSTTTVTQSEATHGRYASDTIWSESASGTTDRSVSGSGSGTSKSRSQSHSMQRRTRRERDLAWARRVVSKQNLNNAKTFKSSASVNSYTTPKSKR